MDPVFISSKTTISIGCNSLTPKEWDEKGVSMAKKENMSPDEIEEYEAYIKLCKKWMSIYCK